MPDPLNPLAADLLEKLIVGSINKIPELHAKYKNSNLFGRMTNAYCEKVIRDVGSIKILGMNKAVPLQDLYVNVNIIDKVSKRQIISVDVLEEQFQKDQSGFGKVIEKSLGMSVIRDNQCVSVLGRPGSGKTTFLKYIAVSCVNNKHNINKIPIFISLKNMDRETISLNKKVNEIFRECGFDSPDKAVDKMLEDGVFIFLFDGLDEVSENESLVIREVENLIKKYPQCKYVISCRTAAYTYVFDQFLDVEISEFESQQVNAFVIKWFSEKPEMGRRCIAEIFSDDNKSIKHLTGSPLLLTLLCIAYEDGMAFPKSRRELYDEAIDALLKKWDKSRGIARREVYKELTVPKKRALLRHVAYHTFKDNKYFFQSFIAVKLIENFVERIGTGIQDSEMEAKYILEDIEALHGIIVERAKHIHSFSHLTFQEYFTAAYICENTEINRRHSLIREHLLEDRWREVFLLVTSMLDSADVFLVEIRKAIAILVRRGTVTTFLSMVAKAVNPSVSYPLPVSRAIALNCIISGVPSHNMRRSLNFGSNWLEKISEALVSRVLNIYAHEFKEELATAEINVLDLGAFRSREELEGIRTYFLRLTDEEEKSLAIYLKASKLLIDCMSVDCMASRSTKKGIIEQFLLEAEMVN